MLKVVSLVSSVLVLAIIAVGCGNDDSEATSVDKASFIEQANAACTESNKKALKAMQKEFESAGLFNVNDESEAIDFEVKTLVPIFITAAHEQEEAIGDIGVPPGADEEINAILDAYDSWAERAEAAPLKVVVAGDVFHKPRILLGEYGAKLCRKSPYEV